MQKTLHATHRRKLLNKICKYEIDPAIIVEVSERTRFCPRTDRRAGRRTNGWRETNMPPSNFVEAGGRGIIICFVIRQVPWASYQICKIAGAHAPGIPVTFSPSPQVSDSDMHHGTCVTHVPWGMPGSLTSGFLWNRRRGKTFPAFPAHAPPAILRIW